MENADIVHFHYPNPLAELVWLTMPPGKRKKKFCICSYQSDPLKPKVLLPFYKILIRAYLGSCDSIVASSEKYRLSSPFLSPLQEQVRVIPLGVEYDDFNNVPKQFLIDAENMLSHLPSPRILFTGRFVYYKGLEYLLRAVATVNGVSCILIGDGPQGLGWRNWPENLKSHIKFSFLDILKMVFTKQFSRSLIYLPFRQFIELMSILEQIEPPFRRLRATIPF